MRRIEYFRWEMVSGTVPGKRIRTRYVMTREDALAQDPTATPIPGTLEVRELPETEEELRERYKR